jgi:hypothetical protein
MRRKTLAIDVGELVILVRARRPLQLHVADIVARFDDDPPMQMDLENILMLRFFVKQVFVVRLLGRVWCK